jgi:hypothetical protein
MSYNSKYPGKQVEAYIDKIALGELDNVYVTEFTIDELLLVVDSNIPLSIDKDSLVNAVKANKVIAIPYNTDNNGGGCIASVEDYGDVIYFYLKNYYSSIKFFVDTNETNAEITTDYIEVVWWQEALYSGENIKTINGEDILGSGDLELPTKDEVVHKEGDETINGVKTFRGGVKLLLSGDDAITIGSDTRVGVEGTTSTVLGLIRGAFFAGSRSYPLYLNGSSERPKYNFDNVELALLSDVSGKQDAIADLDAIRSGASKGATALQSIPSEYVTETELTAKGYATTSALNDKVDKVSGKQLSTEDFTSALKAKLEGLSNYDDTTLANAISGLETRLNTLVSGDASTAIESFNEIMAFLDGIKDTQDLASIIASIEQQIAAKQDKITDLDTIRSGAAKGATALQEESYKGTIVAEDANIPVDEPWDMSFAVLPNGNISVTVNGVSNTFMPATPSGDPMHDIFVNVGAEYNDTGEDIVRTSIYGDNIVWKNAHWWLNDLGDITTDEMRDIYLHSNITQAAKSVSNLMQGIRTRTNIATWTGTWNTKIMDSQIFGYCTALKTARLRDVEHYINTNASWMFTSCPNVEKIFPTLNATSTTSFNGSFDSCARLKEIRLKALGVNCSFAKAQNLSNLSILYMINNSNTSKTLTITLHANAYDRAMADDEIVAALSSHTNITLAKA